MSAELESFFSGLSSSLELAARFEAQAARFAAPSFSVFKYILTSEDGVTRILRDLLDPQGDHGQGALFLRVFLARLGLAVPESELGRAIVRTQVQTPFHRRPDLLIDVPGQLVLGLENKIYAADLDLQVAAYVEFVRSRSKGCKWAIAYLTPNRRPPNERSIAPQEREELQKADQFFCLGYRSDICSWLHACIGVCRADS